MTFYIDTPKDRQAVKDYLDDLLFVKEQHYEAEVKKKRKDRTIDQNSLYWLWITCISMETGQDKEDIHEFFKKKYLGMKECQAFNLTFFIPCSTTKLDTVQMKNYLDEIQIFSNVELGIVLPDPKDLQWKSFYDHYKHFIHS